MPFWFNPVPGNASQAVSMTEAQWRTALAAYFLDVDFIENTQLAGQDAKWVRTPTGDFWIGTGPGTFLPPASDAANANDTTTSAEGDMPVGA